MLKFLNNILMIISIININQLKAKFTIVSSNCIYVNTGNIIKDEKEVEQNYL